MARPKGALNKRTRAALEAAKEGQLDANGISEPVRFMLRIVRDTHKDEGLRLEAAKAAAPYLQPKLSAVEINQPNPDDAVGEKIILDRLKALIEANPGLRDQLGGVITAPTLQ